MMKYYKYFIFERNASFFFNLVIQMIITMHSQQKFKMKEDQYYRLSFAISKNQIIHIQRIKTQLFCTKPEKFDADTWGKFQLSNVNYKDYQKLLSLIQNDLEHTFDLYKEIQKKCLELQIKELEKKPDSLLLKNFVQIINDDFEQTEQFRLVYRDVINENVNFISKAESNKDILLLLYYLNLCLNPYLVFKSINFDFNQFYEVNENMTVQELQAKLK